MAGLRLVPLAAMTPVGGLITGLVMRKSTGKLTVLTRGGLSLLAIGLSLILVLGEHDPKWKYSVFPVASNLGQGIVYPSILFGFIRASARQGGLIKTQEISPDIASKTKPNSECPPYLFASTAKSVSCVTLMYVTGTCRSCSCNVAGVFDQINGNGLGRRCSFYYCSDIP